MQKARKTIIQQMQVWIDDIRKANGYSENEFPEKDELEVLKLAMLKYGCTKVKAEEYLSLIFGRL